MRIGGTPSTVSTAGLTAAQRRLWILDQVNPGSDAHVIRAVVRIEPGCPPGVLEAALADVAAAHAAFRTSFGEDDEGDPVQILHDRAAPAPAGDAPFDLRRPPLIRLGVRCRDGSAVAVTVAAHHIVFDGWSLGVLVADLGRALDARLGGRAADLGGRPSMVDFAAAEAAWLSGAEGARQLAELAGGLRGAPELLPVPTDRLRQASLPGEGPAGAGLGFTLPWDLSEDVTDLVRSHGVTVNMVGLAVFSAVLAHWSASTDIVVGSAFAGRTSLAAEDCVGCFVNVVPIRIRYDADAPFHEHLARVRAGVLAAAGYQDVPFDRLVRAVNPPRTLSHNPLVQVAFGVQNTAPAEYHGTVRLQAQADLQDTEARLDLTLWLEERAGGLHAEWTYRADLFERATIARVNQWFFRALRTVCLDPGVHLARLG
jgi:hypothetical protein